ncbi:hypothetical protein EDD85DRAFT_974741 [Armillaria nabsnona]|nr:hypothetical protein EDD85DRAFT_974741 [Armillaria nabsnona]
MFPSELISLLVSGVTTVYGRITEAIPIFHNIVVVICAIANVQGCLTAHPSDVSDKALLRTFGHNGISPGYNGGPALADINNEIAGLEERERALAARYGLVGDPDSVEVFQKAKARALSNGDSQSEVEVRQLNKLYRLRLQRATMRLSYPNESRTISSLSYIIVIAPKCLQVGAITVIPLDSYILFRSEQQNTRRTGWAHGVFDWFRNTPHMKLTFEPTSDMFARWTTNAGLSPTIETLLNGAKLSWIVAQADDTSRRLLCIRPFM